MEMERGAYWENEESKFNAMFSGVSLVSLLELEEEHHQPPKKKRPCVSSSVGQPPARRPRLSEKMRCLERVVPWDKKMDMGTLLGETFKYIKFLQAQLMAIAAMPNHLDHDSTTSTHHHHIHNHNHNHNLMQLSRSQLLQVVVNSPVAQTALYSKGCCVFSLEQVTQLHNSNAFLFPHHPFFFFF